MATGGQEKQPKNAPGWMGRLLGRVNIPRLPLSRFGSSATESRDGNLALNGGL